MKHKIFSSVILIVLSLSFFFLRNENYFLWLIVSVIIIYISIVAYGVSQIKANYFLNSINKGNSKAIALTFDDGPDAELTPKILEVLDVKKIKASFFVIGKKAEQYPELIKEIVKRGHIICNHTYSHSNKIGFFTKQKLKDDIAQCSGAIEKILNKKPLFFRPPYGVTNPRYANVLNKLNLQSIGWTVRSFDTRITESDKLFNRIKSLLTNGSIILLHDTQKVTLVTLPLLIDYCNKKNIKIVSLPELINKEPYEKM